MERERGRTFRVRGMTLGGVVEEYRSDVLTAKSLWSEAIRTRGIESGILYWTENWNTAFISYDTLPAQLIWSESDLLRRRSKPTKRDQSVEWYHRTYGNDYSVVRMR